jgi:hypothetical protein
MGYELDRDKLLKLFEMKQEKSSLLFSVFSYDGGKAKIGITRSYEKRDGTMGYGNSGRLTIDEIKFLKENLDEIIKVMEESNV